MYLYQKTVFYVGALLLFVSCVSAVRWTQYANKGDFIPAGRAQPAVGIIDDKMYVFGGRQDCVDGTSSCINLFFDDTLKYNFQTNRWSEVAVSSHPSARANTAYATWDNGHSMFIYGGATFNGTGQNPRQIHTFGDLWQFNALAQTWTQPTTTGGGPGTRAGATTVVVGNKMYLFAGLTAAFSTRNDLWVLDLLTFTWTLLVPHNSSVQPHPRFLHYFAYNEQENAFFMGGGDTIPENVVLLNDLWKFSLNTHTWTLVTQGVQPQINGAAATYKDSFVEVFGETRGNSAECFNSVTTFESNPTDRLWISNVDPESHPSFGLVKEEYGPGPMKMMGFTTHRKRLYIAFGFNFFCPTEQHGIIVYTESIFSVPLADLNRLVQDED